VQTNALTANLNATIRLECEEGSSDGWASIGPYKMIVDHLDAEPYENRIASFTIRGKRWHEYWIWLFEDYVEVNYSFYDTSQGDPPSSAFGGRSWKGSPAGFFRYVKDELYPDYLEAQDETLALE